MVDHEEYDEIDQPCSSAIARIPVVLSDWWRAAGSEITTG